MKISINPTLWAGLDTVAASWEEAGCRRFALKGRTDIIAAPVASDGDLLLFPERSSGHKALATALGLA